MIWILAIGVVIFALYEMSNEATSGNDGTFVGALANAIAKAEGADPANNNPGDLTTGDFSSDNVVGVFNSAGVAVVDTLENGWSALKNKLQNIVDGNSSVYNLNMTIQEFADKFTGGDNADSWAQSVANDLGVSTDTTLADAQANFGG